MDALRLSFDGRLVHRGSCGRSLIYLRLDVWLKPPPGRFDEKRARVPNTIVMFDLEFVDRRWRKAGRPLEVLVRAFGWQRDNRTYYAEGSK